MRKTNVESSRNLQRANLNLPSESEGVNPSDISPKNIFIVSEKYKIRKMR